MGNSQEVMEYLEHFGIKGMHWGVRKDRSSKTSQDYKDAQALRKKKPSELSNAELKKLTERINLEKQYNAATTNKQKKAVKAWLSREGGKLLRDVAKEQGPKIIAAAITIALRKAAKSRASRHTVRTVIPALHA